MTDEAFKKSVEAIENEQSSLSKSILLEAHALLGQLHFKQAISVLEKNKSPEFERAIQIARKKQNELSHYESEFYELPVWYKGWIMANGSSFGRMS